MVNGQWSIGHWPVLNYLMTIDLMTKMESIQFIILPISDPVL